MQMASVTITLLAMASGALAGVASTANYDPGLKVFKRQSDDAVCCCCQANGGCGAWYDTISKDKPDLGPYFEGDVNFDGHRCTFKWHFYDAWPREME
ncbi:hypothetical protein PG988_005518 [Apiospora saccharicola]